MAKKQITFSLVLSGNLGLANTRLEQIEAVVNVTGDTDPLTLQKMRDVAEPYFKAKRKGLNTLVETREKEIAASKTRKVYETRVRGFHKLMDERLRAIETDLQKELTAFCKKDKELSAIYAKNKKLFAVEAGWNSAKIVNASMKAFAEGTAGALTGGLNAETLKAVKTCYDLAYDLVGLGRQCKSYYTSEAQQRKIFKEALVKITAIRPPNPVPKSLIDAVEAGIKPYPQKLMAIEANAKATAKKLDKLLKASPPLAKVDDPKVKAEAMKGSRAIKAAIDEIIETNKRVKSGNAFLKYALVKVVEAKKFEKDDEWRITKAWNWANEMNQKYNDYDTICGDADTYIDQMDQAYTAYTELQEQLEALSARA